MKAIYAIALFLSLSSNIATAAEVKIDNQPLKLSDLTALRAQITVRAGDCVRRSDTYFECTAQYPNGWFIEQNGTSKIFSPIFAAPAQVNGSGFAETIVQVEYFTNTEIVFSFAKGIKWAPDPNYSYNATIIIFGTVH